MAATVSTVSPPGGATFNVGDAIDITVLLSEVVAVDTTGGTPQIALDIGGVTRQASYSSGTGTDTLVFSYTVQTGDLDADGIAVSGSAIDLNGGTIEDDADTALTLAGIGNFAVVLVDGVAPAIDAIAPADATPTTATSVDYTVTFDEDVTGLDIGDFALTTTGTAAGTIASITGSGASYTVTVNSVTGDGTLRLDLDASGTGIEDGAGNAIGAGFTAGTTYTIDNTGPAPSSVSVPADSTYNTGDPLDFTVTFDDAVTVTGTPQIELTLGSTPVQATYVSGSGTTDLLFRYIVQADDLDDDGIAVGAAIALNGGTLADAVGNAATLTLAGVGATTAVLVDGVAPAIDAIAPADTTPTTATSVDYTVTFDEDVTGLDIDDFALTATGTAAGTIADITGSGATYTVTVDNVLGDGTLRLDLDASGTGIEDGAGNAIGAGFTAGTTYTVDNTGPAPSSVSVPADSTYNTGDPLDFTVTFDDAVTVTGTPQIELTLGSTPVQATYVSGSGTTDLLFRYIVQADDLDDDGIAVGAAIALNGGTLADAVGNAATLTLAGVGATTAVLVDGVSDVVAPTVSSINRVGSSTPTTAGSVAYTVTFSEEVTGVDTADFALTTTGTAAGTIASVSVSGSTWTVTVDNVLGDGTLRLDLDSTGTGIVDGADNAVSGGFTSGQTFTIDNTRPTPSSVAVPSAGSYNAGDVGTFTVTFSQAVTVDTTNGTPSLPITIGSSTVQAIYASGTGTTELVFSYTILAGQNDSDGIAIGATIASNGGTLRDSAGNPAVLTLAGVASTSAVLVDNTTPTVTSIVPVGTSPTGASSISYTVTFAESVTGVDTADFALTATDTAAGTIASVTGGGTTYVVTVNSVSGAGTLRLDLDASGTGITDAASNAIGAGFTGGSTYTIETTAPTITSLTLPADGSYGEGESLTFTAVLSEAATVDTTGGTPSIGFTIDGVTRNATYVSGSGSNALVFTYVVAAGVVDTDGFTYAGANLTLNSGTIVDGAGNALTLTLPTLGTTTGIDVNANEATLNEDIGATVATGTEDRPLLELLGVVGDPDTANASIVFTVTGLPDNGTVELSGTALVENDSFTRADVLAGLVTFTSGGAGSSALAFSVNDGVSTVTGGSLAIEVVALDAGEELTVTGGTGDDLLIGSDADEVIVGGAGDDDLQGGDGLDTARYSAARSDYSYDASSVSGGGEGSDTLTDIETIEFFDASVEFDASSDSHMIARLYEGLLGRSADTVGLAFFNDLVDEGGSLEDVAQGLLDSTEGAGTAALDDEDFVEQLYTDMLGRASDTGGLAGWLDYLEQGFSRAFVAVGFAQSTEGVDLDTGSGVVVGNWEMLQAGRAYQVFLGRAGDEAGLQSWQERLEGGLSVDQMLTGFGASAEFESLYGSLSDADFVEQMYQNAFGRSGDSGFAEAWEEFLATGALTRAEVAAGFFNATESVSHFADLAENGIDVTFIA